MWNVKYVFNNLVCEWIIKTRRENCEIIFNKEEEYWNLLQFNLNRHFVIFNYLIIFLVN